MNLLVDIGNHRVKWALAAPDEWRVGESAAYGDGISTILDKIWRDLSAPDRVVISSVAGGEPTRQLEQWIAHYWSSQVYLVQAQAELLGVKNYYTNPVSLGSDRWAALIAARAMTRDPVCIVDCGTALTLDALSAQGEFLGGVILPGDASMRAGLLAHAQGIRETKGNAADCFARSTADGVAAGTLFGSIGAIERIIKEYRRALGKAMQAVITGGDAAELIPHLGFTAIVAPDLVLKGLALIAEQLP